MMHTQVAIVGAGPAGLMLSHLLHLEGIHSIVVEACGREYIEERVRAGVLEQGTVDLLIGTGVGERLKREGLRHRGIALSFQGCRRRIDFEELTGGRGVTIYAQHEIIKDLVKARGSMPAAKSCSKCLMLPFTALIPTSPHCPFFIKARRARSRAISSPAATGFTACAAPRSRKGPSPPSTARIRLPGWAFLPKRRRFRTNSFIPGTSGVLRCSACDRRESPGCTYSARPTRISPAGRMIASGMNWKPALATRDGSKLARGPVLQKGVAAMRSFVAEPMQFGRLFLAGDAAHIVPPTGAKGLNLAVADVRVLARGLSEFYAAGRRDLLARYSEVCLRRVWKVQRFSWWMTSMLHCFAGDSGFDRRRQIAELDYVTSSRAAMTSLAENYVGLPMEMG